MPPKIRKISLAFLSRKIPAAATSKTIPKRYAQIERIGSDDCHGGNSTGRKSPKINC
jgi:hypothetical protein